MELLEQIKKFYKNNGFGLLILVITLTFIFHLPFISADPDAYLSFGRGVWIDPGLYTAQLKSFLINGDWLMENSPCLLITPLYSLILLLPSFIFGNSLLVIKITNLLLFLTIIILSVKTNKRLIPVFSIFFLVFGFQFQIFHFLHIGLVETIIAACFCFIFSYTIAEDKKLEPHFFDKKTIIISVVSFGVFLLKIQYAYVFMVYPGYLILNGVRTGRIKNSIINCFYFGVISIVLIGMYVAVWISTNFEFFTNVMSGVDSSKYYLIGDWLKGVSENVKQVFLNWESSPSYYIFISCLLFSFLLLFQKHTPEWVKKAIIFLYVWILLEATKLFQVYLPTRYVLSLYLAVGLFSSLIVYVLIRWLFELVKQKNIIAWQWLPIMLIFVLMLKLEYKNLVVLNRSFDNRTYAISEVNQYFKASNIKKGVVLGAWGATLSASSDFIALPVWYNHFNCESQMITDLSPRVIIAEEDEEDSGFCYKKHLINLEAISDSISTVQIGDWDLSIYWL